MSTYILGISAFYHDSAACLVRDGEIVAAAQGERFTRRKGVARFPRHAVDFCLRAAGIREVDLSSVGFYDKPLLKFERILQTYLGVAPRGFLSFLRAGPIWLKDKLSGREIPAYTTGILDTLLVLAALMIPARLGPINRAWMGLAKITTPIVMGLAYFLLFTPGGPPRASVRAQCPSTTEEQQLLGRSHSFESEGFTQAVLIFQRHPHA